MGFFDEILGPNEMRDNPFLNPMFGANESELDSILSNPNVDSKSRDLARQVRGMERKVAQAGLDPSLTEPRSSLFGEVLDTLDAPRQGVAGVLDAALRGDIFQPGVGTGWQRGQAENTTLSDIFRRQGLFYDPISRGAVGLVGDVLMDPLTYLTFGVGGGLRAGGKALTEGGAALKELASSRLISNGITDIVQHSDIIDEAFKGAARYQEAARNFSKAEGSVRALEADKMAKALDVFSSVLKEEEVVGQELFKRPGLRAGINVPFLGHVTGAEPSLSKEVILQDPGPVGQAMRLAGKIWKPGKIKLADFELSDDVLDAFDNVRLYANDSLAKLGGLVSSVPVVGDAVKATGDALSAANKLFRQVFYQKSLVGAAANNNRLDYLNFKEGAKIVARDRAFETIGQELLQDKGLQKEIYLAIDAQAMGALKDGVAAAPASKAKELNDVINRIRQTGNVGEGEQLMFREAALSTGAEQGFRSRIDNLLADPNVDPRVKDGVSRVMKAMDDVALEEAQAGLGYSRLEYYVPHKYLNLDNVPGSNSGKTDSFLKSRKYDTIADAFEQGGKVADTDLASLLQYRFQKSLTLRAQRQYAQRLMIEEGLDEGLVTKVYKEALIDPSGPAAQALKRNRIELKPLDMNALQDGLVNAEREKVYAGVGLKDPEASRMIADSAAQFQQKVHEELWAGGAKPADSLIPQQALGEIGEKVAIPGGGEMFLPKPIADSFRETIAAKDVLKEALSGTSFGKATLSVLDHATSFFKKMVTLPFPAYWAQNFLGDRFNQVMQGVHAIDPGIFARTHSVLSGKSAIKSANGLMLDKPTLDNIIKQFGMQYSVGDFLGTVESFGKMNIDKFLAEKNPFLENVAKAFKSENRQAALSQLHDGFQKSFDGFFRVSQFVHRFEKGDTIADAVRSANEMYFNYRDMSPVEASLFRRFYMFYGYMSKATKQTLTNLVTAPGNLTMQLHGVNALAEFFSDPNAAPSAEMWDSKLLQSVVTNEQLSRVVGRTPEGRPIIGRGFAAPLNAVMQQFSLQAPRNFTVGELASAATDSMTRTIQKQFATSNPAINAAAQLVSGKNLYFDKPLDAEFLRKVPSLTAAAEKLLGYKHNELPIDLDSVTKTFLKAVPDGKGRLIADPGRMWVLMNLVPGLSRATSMAGTFTNTDIPLSAAALRAGLGVNLDDSDPSRSYLYSRKAELEKFINANSVNQRLKNDRQDQLDQLED